MDEFKELIRILVENKSVRTIHIHEGMIIYDNHIENNYNYVSEKEQQRTSKHSHPARECIEGQHSETRETTELRQRGRPKAITKSLADYVCPDIDVEQLRSEVSKRLSQTMGSAENVAQLEKTLIDEHKIKTVIPYQLLKAEFGELIRCARQTLNKSEQTLKLRT